MAQLETVKGAIDTTALGQVLMHEHVFVLSAEIMQNYPEDWGEEEVRVKDAVDRLNELKAVGIDTIVDLTVTGLGRYIPRIQRIGAQTDLNIIVATGLYTYNDVPHYFHYRGPGTLLDGPEKMTEMFVRDITRGVADTGVKAAILKCATDEPGVTPGVERVLRAVAQAHRQTGVPISTHTHAGTQRGLEQQRIFTEEGVDLSRVVIGHSGDTTDIAYLEDLIANGSYIGMDRFGIDVILPFEERGGHRRPPVRTRPRRQDGALPRRRLPQRLAGRRFARPGHPQVELPPYHPGRHPRPDGTGRDRPAAPRDVSRQSPRHLRTPGRLLTSAARSQSRRATRWAAALVLLVAWATGAREVTAGQPRPSRPRQVAAKGPARPPRRSRPRPGARARLSNRACRL